MSKGKLLAVCLVVAAFATVMIASESGEVVDRLVPMGPQSQVPGMAA